MASSSSRATSMTARAVFAVGLLVLFYVLALAAVYGLGRAGIYLVASLFKMNQASRVTGVLAAGCLLAAGVVLWSILPRPDRFRAPGPRLDEADHPALFAEIRRLGEAAGQSLPQHVYLLPEVNAFVAERGGFMGLGAKRVMGIGLPLFELLTISQLRSVIAHEFGHFHSGDTRLSPWIHKTRAAVGRTINNLGQATVGQSLEIAKGGLSVGLAVGGVSAILMGVQKPFLLFGKAFMRVTQALSRRQEYTADAVAARIAGPEALAGGLEATAVGAQAFQAFVRELVPWWQAGLRPPLLEGFRRFLLQPDISAQLEGCLAAALKETKQDPYDSHPVLPERLAALRALPSTTEVDTRPAASLLGSLEAAEAALLQGLLPGEALAPVAWSQAVNRLLLPHWQDSARSAARAFGRVVLLDVPREQTALRSALLREAPHATLPDDSVLDWAATCLAGAIAEQLVARGFLGEMEFGQSVRLVSEAGVVVEPFAEVRAWLSGKTEHAEWQARCESLGLAHVRLEDTA